jgi:hypothetical protein
MTEPEFIAGHPETLEPTDEDIQPDEAAAPGEEGSSDA